MAVPNVGAVGVALTVTDEVVAVAVFPLLSVIVNVKVYVPELVNITAEF